MGEVRQKIKLVNITQVYAQKEEVFNPEQLEYIEVDALVDTGCTMLVLPQDIVDALKLKKIRKTVVTYADERKEERDVYAGVFLNIDQRTGNFDCIAGPPLSEPLLGQIILEELDLIVDLKERKLMPRPESPFLPLLKMK